MMRPVLETERLLLRPVDLSDAPEVQRLASDHEIARNTASIPHPYPEGAAEAWIRRHLEGPAPNEDITLAVVRRPEDDLVGVVGLNLRGEHRRGELGYWIGREHWGQGYATEAAARIVRFGFEELELHRIHACVFDRNPASARVLRKLGMRDEGVSREHWCKEGEMLNMRHYAVLRSEYARGEQGAKSK
jgi:RimJ/RimL family protein N-acetyltransferase